MKRWRLGGAILLWVLWGLWLHGAAIASGSAGSGTSFSVSPNPASCDGLNRAPVANPGGPYAANLGEALVLDGSGSTDPDTACGDAIVTYAWDLDNDGAFGDTVGAKVTAPQLSPGTHMVALRVTDSFGLYSQAATNLTVYDNRPTAVISAAPNPAGCMQAVSFDATASSHGRPDRAIVSYSWDFADGSTAQWPAGIHKFSQFGAYLVTLTVTDNNIPPATDTASLVVDVSLGNQPPVAVLAGMLTGDAGQALTLDASASSDPDAACGDSVMYGWDIDNDGIIDRTGVQPQVTFQAAGIYPITLTVTDSFGLQSTAQANVTIYSNQPVAAFSANPNPVGCMQAVTFDATASTHGRPDRTIVKYEWDFNYGSTATGAVVSHVYAAFGNYVATLTVTDDNVPARTDTVQVMISSNLNRAPVANPGGPYWVLEGETLVLDGTGSSDEDIPCGDTLASWGWDLDNDGFYEAVGAGGQISAHWDDDSVHTVGLRVTDSFGAVSVAQAVVTVKNAPPVVVVGPAPGNSRLGPPFKAAAVGRRGEEIRYRAEAIDPGADDLTFQWSFGASATYSSQGQAPFAVVDKATATFQSPGVYSVTVAVTDDDGAAGTGDLITVVTDNGSCTRPRGFWRQRYETAHARMSESRRLQAYLDAAGFASRVFAGKLRTLGDAAMILEGARGDARTAAEGELLAAWLNFAYGGVRLSDLIDTDDDGVGDTAFLAVMTQAEGILMDAGADTTQLRQARVLAGAVNRYSGDCG